MYVQTFSLDFETQARTVCPSAIGENESGWVVTGEIHEDWYKWVNDFVAYHPDYGYVRGDFEDEVRATSKEGYDHFMKHHAPDEWDYWDI